MKALIQRVTSANVMVSSEIIGEISAGWVVLLGIGREDKEQDVAPLADKILGIRLFSDAAGKFNLSVLDIKGEILVVSQFTLYADCSRGRRPGFSDAAPPTLAIELYNSFIQELRKSSLKIESGRFGANMTISLVNDGPVTVLLDSREIQQGSTHASK